ncbi:MAG: group II truncated hemoglobin [Blastocatellales bacterium]
MNNTIFEQIGGEENIRRLVDRFYDLMDTREEAAVIRALHPEDLSESREKLYLFLVGWTGGPPLYVQKHGHPRLRARHLPFPIGELERDQWLWCMNQALGEIVEAPLLRQQLSLALGNLADFMRNREG